MAGKGHYREQQFVMKAVSEDVKFREIGPGKESKRWPHGTGGSPGPCQRGRCTP